jgi:sulfonate transport system ATP-binding protein
MSGPVVVRVRNLVRRFTLRGVLDGLDLDIRRGEFVALLGRSGSGKSTLLRALADLDDEAEGSGEIEVPHPLAVIFQDARLLPWRRVLDNVILGLGGPDARERGVRALDEVALAARARSWPYELSGGEQQRVALARSLVREPALLLADEPFGALDALTRIRMHDLMRRLSDVHDPAVLLVTHDVDEAIALADRVVVLEGGKLAADIPVRSRRADTPSPEHAAALKARLLALLGVHDPFDDSHPRPWRELQRPPVSDADRGLGARPSKASQRTPHV